MRVTEGGQRDSRDSKREERGAGGVKREKVVKVGTLRVIWEKYVIFDKIA